MRKISVLTLLLAMSMMTAWADPVTPAVARQAAQQFLTAQGSQLKSEAFRAPSRNMGSVTASPYYVFNASADKGIVIQNGKRFVNK